MTIQDARATGGKSYFPPAARTQAESPSQPFRYVRPCAWSGPILLVTFIIFWAVLGRNLPPLSAALDAQGIADHFLQNTNQVRIAMVVMMVVAVLYYTWGLAITKVMETVEHSNGENNMMSTMQLWGAGFTTLIILFPCALWLSAAFRPEALPPFMLQYIYDLGWLIFDLSFTLTTLQMVALGICFLGDRRASPLLPNWVSWFSIWVGAMFFVVVLIAFAKSGPFSRSGLFNYWFEFSIIIAWFALISVYQLRALTRLESEAENDA